jgi:hypothetical protein
MADSAKPASVRNGENGDLDDRRANRDFDDALLKSMRSNFDGTGLMSGWLALSVFLVSFGVVINNTSSNGEPKVATVMASTGFLFAIWSTTVFFVSSPDALQKPEMKAMLALIILFLLVTVWLIVRIWMSF